MKQFRWHEQRYAYASQLRARREVTIRNKVPGEKTRMMSERYAHRGSFHKTLGA